MAIFRCAKCNEICDTEFSEGTMCEDCQAEFDSKDLEDQLEELLK